MIGADPHRPAPDPRLAFKLGALAVLPIAVALGLIYGLTWRVADGVVRDLVDSESRLVLEREAGPFEELFEHTFHELELLATHPALSRASPAEVASWLGAMRDGVGGPIEELYHFDLEGGVHSGSGSQFSVRDRYYFPAVLRGERVVTRAIISRDTNVPIVLLVVPHRAADGRQLGALGSTVRLSALFERIRELRVGERGFAVLHDEHDFAVTSFVPPGAEPTRGARAPLPAAHPLRSIVDAHELDAQPRRVEVAGTPYLVSSRALTPAPWRLSLCAQEAEALRPLDQLRDLFLAVLGTLVLISALSVVATRRLMTRPLTALGEEERRLALESELLDALSGPGTTLQQLGAALAALRTSLDAERVELWVGASDQDMACVAACTPRAGAHPDGVASALPLVVPGREAQVRVQRGSPLTPAERRRISGARVALGLWVLRDATQTELEVSELRYQRVLEADLVGILSWAEGGAIHDANDALLNMLGYSREELEAGQLKWNEITPPEWAELDRIGLEQVQAHGTCEPFEKEYLHKDGHAVPVVIRGAAVTEDRSAGVAFVLDMSAHHAAEREREELAAQLREARHLEALGTLASGIAHDFNNLLAVILGATQLVLDSGHELGQQRERLEHVLAAGRRAARLVRQVLTFGRQGSAQVQPVAVGPLVEEVLNLQRPSPGVQVALELDPECPLALADPEQLHQVLMNLVGNALYALGERGTLTVRARGADAGERLLLEVSDDGPGIPPELAPRVFEPFFSTKGSEGTGLGLSVVHGIVRAHHGSLDLVSTPGQGTSFRVSLPAAGASRPRTQGPADALPEPGPNEPLRCLVLDDEPLVRRVTRHYLEGVGWAVTEFQDPELALEAFSASPADFDVVLTDFNMPKLNGLQVASHVHALAPDLPVCLLSGWTAPAEEQDLEAHGVRAVISKPFTGDELVASIRRSLR